jgi:sulfonate transport system substrate-binding protein
MSLFSKSSIAVLALFTLIGVHVCAHADVVLRIGYLRTQGYIADFPLAKVTIPGVTLELVPLETGNDVLEALNADAIDIGETGEVQPIFAQSGNRAARVIAATAPQPTATAILVAKDSPIRNVADLRHRKVSFTPGTNTHWLLIQTLGTVGLKQTDVEPVLLNSADAVSALAQGQLDAAIVTAPTIQIAQSRGARVLADGTGLVNSSIYYLANTGVIAGPKRPALDAFVRGLRDHLVWIQAHLNERAAYLGPKYGVPPALVLAASKVMTGHLAPVGDPALASYTQRIADAFHAQKLIPAHIDVRQEFDGSFDKNLPK